MTPRPSVSDFEMSSCHLSSLFLEIVDAHEGPHGLQAYHPARMAAIADLNATRAVFSWTRRTRYFAYLSALALTRRRSHVHSSSSSPSIRPNTKLVGA